MRGEKYRYHWREKSRYHWRWIRDTSRSSWGQFYDKVKGRYCTVGQFMHNIQQDGLRRMQEIMRECVSMVGYDEDENWANVCAVFGEQPRPLYRHQDNEAVSDVTVYLGHIRGVDYYRRGEIHRNADGRTKWTHMVRFVARFSSIPSDMDIVSWGAIAQSTSTKHINGQILFYVSSRRTAVIRRYWRVLMARMEDNDDWCGRAGWNRMRYEQAEESQAV